MRPLKPTGLRELAPTFVVVTLVAYLVVRASYAALPSVPTLAGVTFLVLAAVEAVLAHTLKARIGRRPGTRAVEPLAAARAVALAKASAVAGTVMAGVWVGLLGYVLPRRSVLTAAAGDTPGAAVGLLGAVALVAAALWLQHCCRTPPDSDDPDDRERNSRNRA
jgi:hypothetical protein